MDQKRILICADGSKAIENAARVVVSLRFPPETSFVLLHVVEKHAKDQRLDDLFTPLEAVLSPTYSFMERKVLSGDVPACLLAETRDHPYDLMVMGASGARVGILHRHLGSNANKVIRLADRPVLLARPLTELRKILICTGGEAPSAKTLFVGGGLVAFSSAQVGVLHVMSQLALAASSEAEDLLYDAQTAMQRDTWEGLHLAWAVDQVRAAGVTAEVKPILRHGLVLDQVMAEIREGKYELLVVGAHHVSGKSRTLEAMLENISSDLVSVAPCSVLIV